MAVMNIANLSFAAGPEGLLPAVASLEEKLGAKFKDGGFHPRFGTRNHVLPLTHSQYLEVVEVLADRHLLLVKGSVPGAKNGLLTVRRAVKAGK